MRAIDDELNFHKEKYHHKLNNIMVDFTNQKLMNIESRLPPQKFLVKKVEEANQRLVSLLQEADEAQLEHQKAKLVSFTLKNFVDGLESRLNVQPKLQTSHTAGFEGFDFSKLHKEYKKNQNVKQDTLNKQLNKPQPKKKKGKATILDEEVFDALKHLEGGETRGKP